MFTTEQLVEMAKTRSAEEIERLCRLLSTQVRASVCVVITAELVSVPRGSSSITYANVNACAQRQQEAGGHEAHSICDEIRHLNFMADIE